VEEFLLIDADLTFTVQAPLERFLG